MGSWDTKHENIATSIFINGQLLKMMVVDEYLGSDNLNGLFHTVFNFLQKVFFSSNMT